MSMDVLSTTEVASYLGPPHTAESVKVRVELINGLLGEAWKNPSNPVPPRVKALALEVARRALQNPKGLESITISGDETSKTERYSKASQAGIYLTPAERAFLGGRGRKRSRFGTIRTRPGY